MEKKDGKKYDVLKFFETLILLALIGTAVMIVFEVFSDQMNGEDEEYEDYDYVDYSYDYYEDDYDEYDNYYSNLNNNTENTSASTFVSIEDFMNSEEGKEFLEKSNRNSVTSDEPDLQKVVENTTKNIVSNELENEIDNLISDTEENYNYSDVRNEVEDKFEAQKKKIEIKDEGKSLNDEIMVSVKNNDEDFVYDVTLNTIFFKGDKIVSIDVQDINIIDGNNTKYIKVSEIPEEYDNYEFLISKKHHLEYYNELLNDDISFTSEGKGGYVNISIQNNSSKRVNRIHFTILYLDNTGKLIDFDTVQNYSINAYNKSTLTGFGIWDKESGEYLKYSDYKVILDYAENYGY